MIIGKYSNSLELEDCLFFVSFPINDDWNHSYVSDDKLAVCCSWVDSYSSTLR